MQGGIKRQKNLIKLIIWPIAIMLAGPCFYAAAADGPVIQKEEPEDAKKGSVRIQAVIEPGYSLRIHVELMPESERGVVHEYLLSEENGYELTDMVMEGTYGCVCYVDEEDLRDLDAAVSYEGGSKEAEAGSPEAVYVVVAGSPDYVGEYAWLSYYVSEIDAGLSGSVSLEEIDTISRRLTAMQDSAEEDGMEAEDLNPPEKYIRPAADMNAEDKDDAEKKEYGQEQDVEESFAEKPTNTVAIVIAAAAVTAAFCRAVYKSLKPAGRRQGEN